MLVAVAPAGLPAPAAAAPDAVGEALELSIIMPCLNEAETIGICITKAQAFLKAAGIAGEVLIGDNGSTDGSQQIARTLGARVIDVPVRGYGAALMGAIHAARGRFIIMGDSDDSYDFSALSPFVEALRQGHALVMGNRFAGGIAKGAMPPLHRYLGNPVLSFVGRLFYGTAVRDFHCGLRGFSREAILGLNLVTPGMEFASEMVVKATLQGLPITEVPTTLSPDGRSRPPHLRSWRDGWRHLKFLLTFAPRWLFFYPGMVLTTMGLLVLGLLMAGSVSVGPVELGVHTLLYAAGSTLVGLQLFFFGVLARLFGEREGYWPPSWKLEQFLAVFTVDRGAQIGGALIVMGLVLGGLAVSRWSAGAYGAMNPEQLMRLVVPSVLGLTAGMQVLFSAFFIGLLRQPVRHSVLEAVEPGPSAPVVVLTPAGQRSSR